MGGPGISGAAHTPVVSSVGVVAHDRIQVTAVRGMTGMTGAGVKRNPYGIHALQVDCLQAEVLHMVQRLSSAEPVPLPETQPKQPA